MSRVRPSDSVVDAIVARGAQPRDTGLPFFFVRAVRSLLSIQPRFVPGASRLAACFSAAGAAVPSRGGFLLFLIIAFALPQEAALAQGALTNGFSHAGVIPVGGSDSWTFEASYNDSITVSVGEVLGSGPDPNFVPWVRLRGPDGASLDEDSGSNAAHVAVRAPLTGTYTVLVTDRYSDQVNPASYVLTLAKTPGPYAVSPGDQGGPMTNGATHAGVITVGDLDPWTFEASYNDSITVSLGEVLGSGPDPNFTPWVRLRGPDGASLGDDWGSNAAQVAVRAPLAGTYTVLVAGAYSDDQVSPVSYVLTLAKTPGPYTVSPGDQGGPMTNGANYVGVVRIGDLDPWTFQATANDSITLSLGEVLGSGPDPSFNPWLRLRGPDGTSLGDDWASNAAQVAVRAPLTGTYTVLVANREDWYVQASPGSYVLTLAKTPGPYSVSPGDEGGPMTNGADHAGVVPIGDLDPWTFQAAANDSITVSLGEVLVSGPDPNFVPWLRLRGPDGALLGDDWGSNAAQIAVRAPLAGTYTVLVANRESGYVQSGPVSYSLTVAKTPGPYAMSPGDEGGPMTNGASHVGVITVGDLDPWTFQAAANDSITLSLDEVVGSGPDPHFNPWTRLRGPDGASLGDNWGSNTAQIGVRAALTGTYTVLVANREYSSQVSPGSYSLKVTGLTATCSIDCAASAPSTGQVGQSLSFTSSAAPSNCTGSLTYSWVFGDGATSSSQNPTHTYGGTGTYTWSLTATVGSTTCQKSGTVTISSASCALSCSATVPATGTVGTPVTFSSAASATPSACTTPVFDWNFGDGSAHSTQQNPAHSYATQGSFTWTLTVSGAGAPSCVRTGTITGTAAQRTLTGLLGFSSGKSGVVDLPLNGPEVSVGIKAKDSHGWTETGSFDRTTGRYNVARIPTQDTSITLTLTILYSDHISVVNENLRCAVPGTAWLRTTTRSIDIPVPPSGVTDIVLPNPVAFIHGILSCYDMWDSWAGDLRTPRDADPLPKGYITFQPNHHYWTGNLQTKAAADVALQIADDYAGLTAAGGGLKRPVDLICHSEGGVAARVFDTAFPQWDVKRVFTLGTPHSGTDFLFGAGTLFGLDSSYMTGVFNYTYPSFDAPVYAISGRKSSCRAMDDGIVFWRINRDESPFNIDIPSWWNPFSYTQLQHFAGQEGWMGLPDKHNFCYSHGDLVGEDAKEDILHGTILPILRGAPIRAGKAAAIEAGAPLTGASLVSVRTTSLALDAGILETLDVPIGLTDEAVFQVALAAGDGVLKVKDPNATVIDPSTAQSYPGATYTAGPMGYEYTVLNPKPGPWALLYTAGSAGSTGAVGAQEDSLWALSGGADSLQYQPGGVVSMTARISGANPGVSVAQVSAVVANEAGQAMAQVPLLDDGVHGDQAAGDGVFGYQLPAPVTPGFYRITFSMVGVAAGTAVAREAQAGLSVLAVEPLLTGTFSDHAGDEDSDGTNDHIDLTAQLNLPVAGAYTAWADLLDAGGYPVGHVVGSVVASAPGTTSVDLEFEASGLTCPQFDSPFGIKNLSISGPNTLAPWQAWSAPVTTQTYNGSSFGCSATKQVSPKIVSLSPNAAFPGETKNAILSGSGFLSGTHILVSGSGVDLSDVERMSDEAMSLTFAIDPAASAGTRDLSVTNPDGKTVTASGLLVVSADQPPSVAFSYPADGSAVNGVATVSANAADDRGLQMVELLADGALVATDEIFPYQFSWDTRLAAPGSHLLVARATDSAGLSSEASIHVTTGSPCEATCTATVPATGSAGKTVAFSATAVPADCTAAVSFSWDFGDSRTSTERNSSHTYAAGGSYGWDMTASAGGVTCKRSGTIAISGGAQQLSYTVSSQAHLPGAGGTQWRSNVAAVNRTATAANLTLTYFPYSAGAPQVVKNATLGAGATVEWPDILVGLFGQSGSPKGSVQVVSDQPLYLMARTFNQAPSGTYGQYYPAVCGGQALAAGQVGVLPMLKKSAAFRTNIGILNVGDAAVTALVKLFNAAGVQAGNSKSLTASPSRYIQQDDIFANVGAGNQDIAYATVEVQTAAGKIWAYASVVDAVTGDPTTVPVIVQ